LCNEGNTLAGVAGGATGKGGGGGVPSLLM